MVRARRGQMDAMKKSVGWVSQVCNRLVRDEVMALRRVWRRVERRGGLERIEEWLGRYSLSSSCE